MSHTSNVPANVLGIRLQQRVEGRAAVAREGVRRGGEVYALPGEHGHALRCRADAFQLRQVRVEVERPDPAQQAQPVERAVDLDGRGSAVGGHGRTQAEAVFDRHAEPGEQAAREAAEALARRNAGIAMVQMLGDLPVLAGLPGGLRGFPDVMMRADEDRMIGIVEEAPDRRDFRLGRHLAGAEGVEADDDDGVRVRNCCVVEQRRGAVLVHAFDLDDGMLGQRAGQLGESGEIRLLDVVEEASDALIDIAAVRQALISGIEEPAQLEDRREAIFDDGQWRARLRRMAPGKIEENATVGHLWLPLRSRALPVRHRQSGQICE